MAGEQRGKVVGTIKVYGSPALRATSAKVKRADSTIRAIAERMSAIVHAAGAAGLAANQMGVLKRIIVVNRELLGGEGVDALINPKITEREGEFSSREGCLSIPGLTATIKRTEAVTVQYKTPSWEERVAVAMGAEAAVIQHEIDHLNGVLITDRISTTQRSLAKKHLRKLSRLRSELVIEEGAENENPVQNTKDDEDNARPGSTQF